MREDIATFEARNITPEIRQSVEELLNRNKASFDPKVSCTHRQNKNEIYVNIFTLPFLLFVSAEDGCVSCFSLLFLTCDTTGVVMGRMQSALVQQLLLSLPGSKPMSSTPTFWRRSSHWRGSRLDYRSRNTQAHQRSQIHTKQTIPENNQLQLYNTTNKLVSLFVICSYLCVFFCVCDVCRNLRKTESRKNKLEDQLNSVGARVHELKEKYGLFLIFSSNFWSFQL